MKFLAGILKRIGERVPIPDEKTLRDSVMRAKNALLSEGKELRPPDPNGLPGGVVFLKRNIPVILVPDLHGRYWFFQRVMDFLYDRRESVLNGLARKEVQVVCLGDGFHGEARAAGRWRQARMDEEMSENFRLMRMVMEVKAAYPDVFHFLKGNHENISNENGQGNYAFGKFVNEGEMVAAYVRAFFSQGFMRDYYEFEKLLPVLAVGKNFLASHAEPARFFARSEVIGYRRNPEVIYGLTWTDNGEAETGAVRRMLDGYLSAPLSAKAYYFGGHRPVSGEYDLRADGRYVQIHNPSRFIIALIDQSGDIDLRRAIIDLDDVTDQAGR